MHGNGLVQISNRPRGENICPASEMVSPDALALVRFGLRAADDPRILNTIKVIDATLKMDHPSYGPVWYRYNRDGYGEQVDGKPFQFTGIGRPWPLLTGERGHYEVAAGNFSYAEKLLKTMENYANETGLFPEQVWDSDDVPELGLYYGKPTGAAMPLAWAHSEYIKLSRSIKAKKVFDMPVVVGKEGHNTVIFTGDLNQVVFAPYWNVPPGIMKNEILPAINRNPNYLAQHHMEWNGNYVRQKPGPWNALGKVKFLFPNNFHIYLHDTPAKGLFNQQKRAFSHGCIRIEDPQRMAEWVLRDQPEWTTERILQAMNGSEEKYVTVDRDIPVVIGYFTAWVSANGSLNFREDVYGHDAKLAQRLFER